MIHKNAAGFVEMCARKRVPLPKGVYEVERTIRVPQGGAVLGGNARMVAGPSVDVGFIVNDEDER